MFLLSRRKLVLYNLTQNRGKLIFISHESKQTIKKLLDSFAKYS